MYRNYMQKNSYDCGCNDNYMEENLFNDICANVKGYNKQYDECECGFEESESLFPDNPMFGQSYVPWQIMSRTYKPEVGWRMGTIFPELVSPYMPGQSEEEMEYIASRNKIGEGCNK